jgi:hypothetical protein
MLITADICKKRMWSDDDPRCDDIGPHQKRRPDLASSFTRRLLSLIFVVTALASAQTTAPLKDIPAIANAAHGAIVTVIMAAGDKPITQGTGFLVSSVGIIVTNYHVIKEGNVAVVKFPDGTVFPVDGILAVDKVRDLALIRVHGKTFRTLTLGNSDRIQVGEEVVAIGNPLSLESTVSNGIISGVRSDKEAGGKFLQTTAPISPGSSGGPLFNMHGEVVGINTMYLEGGENLNFAIPVNDAKRLLLNQSTKLHSLPNETDPAKTQTQDHEEATTGARHYYRQLLEAGAFSLNGKNSYKGMLPTEDYACFSDDPQSDTFFTFVAKGYNQRYAEIYPKWFKLVIDSSSDFQETEKYYHEMQAIQETADYPYMRFIRTEELNKYPSDLQKVYRDGTRSLTAHVYEMGVKTATISYVGLGRLYGEFGGEWHAPAAGSSHHLTIEPSTMRYVVRYFRTGAADTSQAGVCEKVDPDQEPK